MSEMKNRYIVTVDDKEFDLYLSASNEGGKYIIEHEGVQYKIVADSLTDKKFLFKIDNMSSEVDIVRKDDYLEVFLEGKEMISKVEPYYLAELRKMAGEKSGHTKMAISAPMPGLVLQIDVKSGDNIKKGQTLLIIEAMKMENMIKSPHDGIIKEIYVSAGEAVNKNEKLVEFE
ncbi:MAG: biotin/lipoyl-containing protein [Candidatus Zixiibacteriota bacterium]